MRQAVGTPLPLPWGWSRWVWAVAALVAILFGSFAVGRYPVMPGTAARILASRLLPIEANWPVQAETVVLAIRLPRILAAMMVGAALSVSGAAFQGVFRNPMVSPDILGVTAGAGLGAALAILLGLDPAAVQAAAFASGLAAVCVTCGIGARQLGRGGGIVVMVLAGIIVGMVFSAGIALVKYAADPNNTLPAITFWLMGSLASATSRDLGLAGVPIGAGMTILMLLRWRLNLLSFGDEEARALGLDVRRTRLAVIVGATLVTAAAVAVGGVIGLVGLVVPHMARLLVGPNHRALLPACAVLGAGFLLVADDAARGLAGGEIPLGILTSLVGAPVFLFLLIRLHKE